MFRFNAVGQIVGMRTTDTVRSMSDGAVSRDPYCCYYRNYATMGGSHALRIPTEVEVRKQAAMLPPPLCLLWGILHAIEA